MPTAVAVLCLACLVLAPSRTFSAAQAPTHPDSPRPESNLPSRVTLVSSVSTTNSLGERLLELRLEPEVRILANAPAVIPSGADVLLTWFALPNGNTIEQTIGRKPKPGDDWHFDIQHIGAQTRFLRQHLTNRVLVVAYLETTNKSWPAWRKRFGDALIPEVLAAGEGAVAQWAGTTAGSMRLALASHSGGGSLVFGYINKCEAIPARIERIAFLDSNYSYDKARGHTGKLEAWVRGAPDKVFCVLAYDDASALLDGKAFVSAAGGTWGRSHAMLADLGAGMRFSTTTNSGLETWSALEGRAQFLLKQNPDRKILHTVQVEKNGFIHSMLCGTPQESKGYSYLGERAYERFIAVE